MTDETESIEQKPQTPNRWTRVLYMLLFFIAYSAAEFVLGVVVIIQLIITLVTGSTNTRLKAFGKQVSLYVYDVLLFLTFNTEEKPFPYASWPDEKREVS